MGANLAGLVRAAAAARPGHPALVAGQRSLTWAQVDAAVDAAAAGMQALGLAPGARVALALPNGPEFVAAYFGVLRAGLVAVPVTAGATAPEVSHLAGDAGARAVVFDRTTAAAVRGADLGADVRRVVVGAPAPGETAFAAFSGTPREPDTAPEDLAVLLYTAGTSGRPKGAMLSHRALLANVEQVHDLAHPAVTPDDVVLVALPLSHLYALNGTLAQVVRCAATAVLVERFDPVETLALVRDRGVTNVPGAPGLFLAWSTQPGLRAALAGVRLLVTGAAPMPAAVVEQVTTATGLPVFEGYGLTEAGPAVSSTLVEGRAKPGCVGKPLPGVEVRLLDEDGEETEEGDPGEVCVRGANLFSGYWPDGADGPDAQGWFPTGDVAYVDADGDLVLVDRRIELILVSGFNVYPREVEAAVATHPAVAEVAVVGVPHPATGEAVKAFVVPRAGADLTPEDVLAHVAPRLARFKRPTIVSVVESLPHSATGKVAKARLREESS
ncbi:MAG: AMP-binding protein [Actinomycetia bacterium]|nr:AMP-binding protein [Actinomycetes bacterium]